MKKLYHKNDGYTIDTMMEIVYTVNEVGDSRQKRLTDNTKGGSKMEQSISEVLRSKRKQLRLTQDEVASKAGVSRPYYADVEHGRYTPSLKLLTRLSVLFDIDLNFLKENVGNTIKKEA